MHVSLQSLSFKKEAGYELLLHLLNVMNESVVHVYQLKESKKFSLPNIKIYHICYFLSSLFPGVSLQMSGEGLIKHCTADHILFVFLTPH